VGQVYREFLASNGYKKEIENIFAEYEQTGLKNNYELVSDSMVRDLCISGTPNDCKKQLDEFYQTGIDLPIIQFNPIDDVQESFDLLTTTFSEEID
jgi:alkanesulfonate monooxygenase SsuD/methylene tetrahydromethanopterin reductase-like flavin-dependent oxidoreductase (luciferase family)